MSIKPVKNSELIVSNFKQLRYLPSEIWLNCFMHLESAQDVLSLSLTHRDIYQLRQNPILWKALLQKHFPYSHGSYLTEFSEFEIFKNLSVIKQNLMTGKFKINEFHVDASRKCDIPCSYRTFHVHNNYLFRSHYNIVRIFNLETGKDLKAIDCKQGFITAIFMVDDEFFTGCQNGVLKRWDFKSGNELESVHCIQDSITSISVQGDLIFVASQRREFEFYSVMRCSQI